MSSPSTGPGIGSKVPSWMIVPANWQSNNMAKALTIAQLLIFWRHCTQPHRLPAWQSWAILHQNGKE
jgi:hypothetical protein